jgi:hypothetical protein
MTSNGAANLAGISPRAVAKRPLAASWQLPRLSALGSVSLSRTSRRLRFSCMGPPLRVGGPPWGMILPPEIEALIASPQRELEALRAENAEFRRRLGLDSSTSSKLPSSDGAKRSRTGRAAFAKPPASRAAGSGATKGDTLRQSGQAFDLSERLIEVTKHRAPVYVCADCGGERGRPFPKASPRPRTLSDDQRARNRVSNPDRSLRSERQDQWVVGSCDLIDLPLFGEANSSGNGVEGWNSGVGQC